MEKLCNVCSQAIKDNDVVIAIIMAKFHPKPESYDLDAMRTAIVSHVICAEGKQG